MKDNNDTQSNKADKIRYFFNLHGAALPNFSFLFSICVFTITNQHNMKTLAVRKSSLFLT